MLGPFELAFGDESGQIGFKFMRGSTEFFVFSLLLTNDLRAIEHCMATFRLHAGLQENTEVKFHSTPDQLRDEFLAGLLRTDAVVRAAYVRKPLLPHVFTGMKGWDFYAFIVSSLLERLPIGELGNTRLILDEFGPHDRTMQALRARLDAIWPGVRRSLIRRIRFRSSAQQDGLQAVDMAGGAVYRWLAERDRRFLEIIEARTMMWEIRPTNNLPT